MNTPQQIQELLAELNSLPTDFNGVTLVSELINNGLNRNKIQFKNIGIFHRNVDTDISEIEYDKFIDDNEDIVFCLSREGLYDIIPESLIHKQGYISVAETLAEQVKRKKKEEADAKNFFSIFENEFHNYVLDTKLKESEIFYYTNTTNNALFFEYFFGTATQLNDTQIQMLLHIIPLSYKIRANSVLIEKLYSKILSYPVHIKKTFKENTYYNIAKDEEEMLLGINFVTGNSIKCFEWVYDIFISEVDNTAYLNFQPNGANYNLLQVLNKYFIPTMVNININLVAQAAHKTFTLSNQEHNSYLTFNTII